MVNVLVIRGRISVLDHGGMADWRFEFLMPRVRFFEKRCWQMGEEKRLGCQHVSLQWLTVGYKAEEQQGGKHPQVARRLRFLSTIARHALALDSTHFAAKEKKLSISKL